MGAVDLAIYFDPKQPSVEEFNRITWYCALFSAAASFIVTAIFEFYLRFDSDIPKDDS